MILIVDNYDSFTHNLVHGLGDAEVRVVRNDAMDRDAIAALDPSGIILSPGPGSPAVPRDIGVCADLITAPLDVPMLGVCLGMQAMAHLDGGKVGPAPDLVHGESSQVELGDHALFRGVDVPTVVGRYHSLCVRRIPPGWTALGSTGGVLMAMAHEERPWVGVQFHPESILSPQGPSMLGNFMEMCR